MARGGQGVLFFLVMAFPVANAATYYVDPATGHDGNSGASNNKLKSIAGAVAQSTNGDVIMLAVRATTLHPCNLAARWRPPSLLRPRELIDIHLRFRRASIWAVTTAT